ncbi:unnamed protein product [Boreogadus saida]
MCCKRTCWEGRSEARGPDTSGRSSLGEESGHVGKVIARPGDRTCLEGHPRARETRRAGKIIAQQDTVPLFLLCPVPSCLHHQPPPKVIHSEWKYSAIPHHSQVASLRKHQLPLYRVRVCFDWTLPRCSKE